MFGHYANPEATANTSAKGSKQMRRGLLLSYVNKQFTPHPPPWALLFPASRQPLIFAGLQLDAAGW
jgi:hypothetical protein